jgi:hypothetical protein
MLVSCVHVYLVWHHRDNRKYSISEHAIIDTRSHLIYLITHVICDVLFLAFSYQFFMIEHGLTEIHYLIVIFAGFDFLQALLPSRGITESMHFAFAYISWVCYLAAGVAAMLSLHVTDPYKVIALLLLVPVLGMFAYLHVNRSRLYFYQLLIVPIYVLYMVVVVIGAA